MMSIFDKDYQNLTRDERKEAKQALILQMNDSVSFKEYCEADIPDEQAKAWFEGNKRRQS